MSTGQRIKELRQRRNLTQEHMAERLGISTQGYNKLENEKTEWNLTYLKKTAQELGVTVGYLAEDEGIVVNYYGEIKDGGNTENDAVTYNQENTQLMQMLQDERRFWQEKFQQEQEKHQQEITYYKSVIDKLLGQK